MRSCAPFYGAACHGEAMLFTWRDVAYRIVCGGGTRIRTLKSRSGGARFAISLYPLDFRL